MLLREIQNPRPGMRDRKSQIANRTPGFTLVEVLVVISVISILLTMLFVAIPGALRSSKARSTQMLLSQVGMAVGMYYDIRNVYPKGKATSPYAACRTLVAELGTLLKVRSASFIDTDNDSKADTVVDGWGRPFIYTRYISNAPSQLPGQSNGEGGCQPLFNARTFELFSAGAYADRVSTWTNHFQFQTNFLTNNGISYAFDGYKVKAGTRETGEVNRYVGNW